MLNNHFAKIIANQARQIIPLLMICLSFPLTVQAMDIPEPNYERTMQLALQNFWGKARMSGGRIVQPDSENERMTLPISSETAKKVIDAGTLASVADLCGLDWKEFYLKVTENARNSNFTAKQVAFIGFLFGMSMGQIDASLRDKQCPQNEKRNISFQLKQASVKSINFNP